MLHTYITYRYVSSTWDKYLHKIFAKHSFAYNQFWAVLCLMSKARLCKLNLSLFHQYCVMFTRFTTSAVIPKVLYSAIFDAFFVTQINVIAINSTSFIPRLLITRAFIPFYILHSWTTNKHLWVLHRLVSYSQVSWGLGRSKNEEECILPSHSMWESQISSDIPRGNLITPSNLHSGLKWALQLPWGGLPAARL